MVKVTFNCLTPVQKFVGKNNVLLTRVFTHSEAIAAMRQQEAKVPKLPAQARLLQEALKKRGLVQDSAQDAQQAPKGPNMTPKTNTGSPDSGCMLSQGCTCSLDGGCILGQGCSIPYCIML